MRLTPTEEQVSLAEAVRDWGDDRAGIGAARAHPNAPVDTRAGLAGAAQLGLLGLLDPAEGGTQRDLSVVVSELGATATDVPVGASALALSLVVSLGLDGLDVEAIAEGEVVLLPAVAEPDEATPVAVVADGAVTLDGTVALVAGGLVADSFLVLARTDTGTAVLALVAANAPGVTVTPRVTLDISRGFAAVGLVGVTVGAGSWTGDAQDSADLLFDVLAAHAVADAVGAAAELADRTVAYVKQREQFGQPVGKFQAVKHHCATMALDVDSSQAALRGAANALDGTDARARALAVSVAASYAGEACARVAGTALQLHGGMGFTWEHDLHVLLRRIKTDELLAGSPRWHRQRLARLLA